MLLDGAFGSLVIDGDPKFYMKHHNTSLYLFNNPYQDQLIHNAYLNNGSDIVSAHTFSLSSDMDPISIITEGLCHNARAMANIYNKKVALTLSPQENYLPILEAGVPYCDYILLETFTSLHELENAIEQSLLFSKPIISCMVFGKHFSYDGTSVQEYYETISPFCEFIGFNCVELEDLETLLPSLPSTHNVVIQPNKGIPSVSDRIVYPSFDYNKFISLIQQYNIPLVGMCCGSSPKDIRILKERIG